MRDRVSPRWPLFKSENVMTWKEKQLNEKARERGKGRSGWPFGLSHFLGKPLRKDGLIDQVSHGRVHPKHNNVIHAVQNSTIFIETVLEQAQIRAPVKNHAEWPQRIPNKNKRPSLTNHYLPICCKFLSGHCFQLVFEGPAHAWS